MKKFSLTVLDSNVTAFDISSEGDVLCISTPGLITFHKVHTQDINNPQQKIHVEDSSLPITKLKLQRNGFIAALQSDTVFICNRNNIFSPYNFHLRYQDFIFHDFEWYPHDCNILICGYSSSNIGHVTSNALNIPKLTAGIALWDIKAPQNPLQIHPFSGYRCNQISLSRGSSNTTILAAIDDHHIYLFEIRSLAASSMSESNRLDVIPLKVIDNTAPIKTFIFGSIQPNTIICFVQSKELTLSNTAPIDCIIIDYISPGARVIEDTGAILTQAALAVTHVSDYERIYSFKLSNYNLHHSIALLPLHGHCGAFVHSVNFQSDFNSVSTSITPSIMSNVLESKDSHASRVLNHTIKVLYSTLATCEGAPVVSMKEVTIFEDTTLSDSPLSASEVIGLKWSKNVHKGQKQYCLHIMFASGLLQIHPFSEPQLKALINSESTVVDIRKLVSQPDVTQSRVPTFDSDHSQHKPNMPLDLLKSSSDSLLDPLTFSVGVLTGSYSLPATTDHNSSAANDVRLGQTAFNSQGTTSSIKSVVSESTKPNISKEVKNEDDASTNVVNLDMNVILWNQIEDDIFVFEEEKKKNGFYSVVDVRVADRAQEKILLECNFKSQQLLTTSVLLQGALKSTENFDFRLSICIDIPHDLSTVKVQANIDGKESDESQFENLADYPKISTVIRSLEYVLMELSTKYITKFQFDSAQTWASLKHTQQLTNTTGTRFLEEPRSDNSSDQEILEGNSHSSGPGSISLLSLSLPGGALRNSIDRGENEGSNLSDSQDADDRLFWLNIQLICIYFLEVFHLKSQFISVPNVSTFRDLYGEYLAAIDPSLLPILLRNKNNVSSTMSDQYVVGRAVGDDDASAQELLGLADKTEDGDVGEEQSNKLQRQTKFEAVAYRVPCPVVCGGMFNSAGELVCFGQVITSTNCAPKDALSFASRNHSFSVVISSFTNVLKAPTGTNNGPVPIQTPSVPDKKSSKPKGKDVYAKTYADYKISEQLLNQRGNIERLRSLQFSEGMSTETSSTRGQTPFKTRSLKSLTNVNSFSQYEALMGGYDDGLYWEENEDESFADEVEEVTSPSNLGIGLGLLQSPSTSYNNTTKLRGNSSASEGGVGGAGTERAEVPTSAATGLGSSILSSPKGWERNPAAVALFGASASLRLDKDVIKLMQTKAQYSNSGSNILQNSILNLNQNSNANSKYPTPRERLPDGLGLVSSPTEAYTPLAMPDAATPATNAGRPSSFLPSSSIAADKPEAGAGTAVGAIYTTNRHDTLINNTQNNNINTNINVGNVAVYSESANFSFPTRVVIYSSSEPTLQALANYYSVGVFYNDQLIVNDDPNNHFMSNNQRRAQQRAPWLERIDACKKNAEAVFRVQRAIQASFQQLPTDKSVTTVGLSSSVVASRLQGELEALNELYQIWNLMAVALNLFIVSSNETDQSTEKLNPDGTRVVGLINSWMNSAIGRPLLIRLLTHLVQYSHINGFSLQKQALSTIICVIGHGNLEMLLSSPTYLSSQLGTSDFKTPTIPFADHDHHDFFQRLLVTYAELLACWHLPVQATVVRKHIENQSKESRFEFIINVESCCQFCGEIILHAYEPGQSHSGLLLSDSTEGVTATMPSSSTTAKRSGLWCHRCERHGVNCSICEQSLKESAFFCTQCGHGFHSEEIAAWFSKHVECPGGCGCRCGEMYQQEEELYQNELWASRHLMPSQAQFSLAET